MVFTAARLQAGAGGGKGTNHTRAPGSSPAVSKCKIKKKKKAVSPLAARLPFPQEKQKCRGGRGRASSAGLQPARVSRPGAVLRLRKSLTRSPSASRAQQEPGVPVSVSPGSGLALARARSPRLPPSLSPSAGWELPPDPAASLSPGALTAFFLSFPTWRGPGCGARGDRAPCSTPP